MCWRNHVVFVFDCINIVYYIGCLSATQPTLYLGMAPTWSWSIILFYVAGFHQLVFCWIFASIFVRSFVLFLFTFVWWPWFWYQSRTALMKWVGEGLFPYETLCKSFWKMDTNSSFNIGLNSPLNPFGPGLSFAVVFWLLIQSLYLLWVYSDCLFFLSQFHSSVSGHLSISFSLH